MFSPAVNALDLNSRLNMGQLVQSQMQLGTWASCQAIRYF